MTMAVGFTELVTPHLISKPDGRLIGSYPSKMQNIFGFLTFVWYLVWNRILIQKPVVFYVVGGQGERRVCLLG